MLTSWFLGVALALAGGPTADPADMATAVPTVSPEQVEQIVDGGGSEALAAKLSAEQAYDILRMQARPDDGVEDWAIPIVFFFVAALITIAILLYRYRRNGQLHETIRLMVEKGVEIPKNLFERLPVAATDLRRGIILIAGGVGFTIFLALVTKGEDGAWSVGLVPIFVGAGFLLSAQLRKRAEDDGDGRGRAIP